MYKYEGIIEKVVMVLFYGVMGVLALFGLVASALGQGVDYSQR